jgi:hypothetical protein
LLAAAVVVGVPYHIEIITQYVLGRLSPLMWVTALQFFANKVVCLAAQLL